MVLGKLPVPGRRTNLDYSTARAYCACSRCGWGLFGHFLLDFKISRFFKMLLSTVTPTGALVKTFNKSNTINIRGKLQALVLTTG